LRGLSHGQLPNYIPELTRADPEWFGICIVTRDGFVYEVAIPASISRSSRSPRPLTYGLALECHGEEAVLKRIGVEPSGDSFTRSP
jgi:glutaminase